MYQLLAKTLIRRSLRFHQTRNIDGLLSTYADDVHFSFYGSSSWGGEYHGKPQVRLWLERFHRVGLDLTVHEILVAGLPWNMTVCLYLTDQLKNANGELVYANRGVIYARAAWGKIKRYEVFEDTEKLVAFDKYLAMHMPALANPVTADQTART